MSVWQPLHPFAEAPAVTLRAGIERRPDGLFLSYLLAGDLAALLIPPASDMPSRLDRLWETTCLECFFGEPGRPGYREINLSPTGDWNLYAFDDYRQGMREEPAVKELAVTVTTTADTVAVSVLLPTAGLLPAAGTIEAGLCAVLQEQSGRRSFWALTHPAAQPDFHDRRGFVLHL
ncbi:MAG: DOMON-like domain-containing protein [Desulfobulbaceae bacterium]|nr:DOMON-like domain-containing protein [Desulfobulbaceae bacterium]